MTTYKPIYKEMTKKQSKFFNNPRSMDEIINLFMGDAWAANQFQNDMLSNGQLTTVIIDKKIKFIKP